MAINKMKLTLCLVRRILTVFLIVCWFAVGFEGFRNTYVSEQFDQISGDKIVLFWAEWCPHCKTIKSKNDTDGDKDWDSLERQGGVQTSKGRVPAINYEVDEAPELINRFGVKSFPTVMLVKDSGKHIVQENGDRTVEGWGEFVRKNI